MSRSEQWARSRFAESAVARFATVRAGRPAAPHVVPIVFAVVGDVLYTAVDDKPKRSPRLQRLANLSANPDVCVLVDHYEADWASLWWARADGTARLLDDVAADVGLRALVAKYPQYRHTPPPGPVVAIDVTRWSGWSAR